MPALEKMFRIGLDLATLSDHTALAVLEAMPAERAGQRRFDVVHLQRWRGEPYAQIVADVADILSQEPLYGRYRLLVDATGVGVPIVEQLRQAGLLCTAITITGGAVVGRNAIGVTVPKAALINAFTVVVQQRRIRIAADLEEEGRALAHEMELFARRQNVITGANQYAVWESGEHDDLVMATALPIWDAEHRAPWIAAVDANMRNPPSFSDVGYRGRGDENLTVPRVGTWQQWPAGAFGHTVQVENEE